MESTTTQPGWNLDCEPEDFGPIFSQCAAVIRQQRKWVREETGPVFSITATGKLHMRFTIRKKQVIWADNSQTKAALSALRKILTSDSPYIFKLQLESGMGLLSNNVLHNRSAFVNDSEHVRHFYRSRYFDRIKGT